ncbi:hypothetical protein [Corynebacterium sp.]|uniref:hypothetical protein n=1 Tax=Corynebacterium sp. TaxID=1720 RepID=UPI0026DC38CE|nr:hypothetical protein [Corynebacterium sp.]MDO5075917.1 hypothetical protein [Corynebacterium sp.]
MNTTESVAQQQRDSDAPNDTEPSREPHIVPGPEVVPGPPVSPKPEAKQRVQTLRRQLGRALDPAKVRPWLVAARARGAAFQQWYRENFRGSRRERIVLRLVAWMCIPVFALTGWEAGQAYTSTRDLTYVVDTKILVTNPRIEDPDEHQRLIALGKTRDDTVFLGAAMRTEDFHRLLVGVSGVADDSFEITGNATRAARTINVRVTSSDPKVTSLVAVHSFGALQQYLDQHRGSVYLDTAVQSTQPEGISAYYAGVGADWPVAGTILGMMAGFTVVVLTARLPRRRKVAP